MTQDIIVWIIVAITIAVVIYNMVKSITSPKKGGCGGCTGCDMSAKNKGCCSSDTKDKTRLQFSPVKMVR